MKILPAIDLLEGKCVRLQKGDYKKVTVYSDDPVQIARKWVELGAEGLHLVDLDGAKAGKPVNTKIIKAISDKAGVPVEIGGGIRSVQAVQDYFDLGVYHVILGTAAIEQPDLVLAAADLFPDRILVGMDVKDGKPATKGWIETVVADPLEMAEKFAAMGAARIIYTDISRDGMLKGANVEELQDFASRIDIPVTASGGVTSIDDVVAIAKLERYGVDSMIIGKALYDGYLKLDDVISTING
ncbi:MAG TPA: 1-(5-phosphoribosyl)-5-[(5-phosphoribosylamino)methylideneamino]imidazole-4-carboxamide isomerase [Nitrospinota bacterium]|nr:1-(5-phosphoribosyl)-5-[(5-phosphoribosylamino)methylideneamino]imidazole-4-carboxamide isomerase [Nitrospinota bacterium]|tara:strand:- start:32507 stop:33232 length:726 start_codon:yes stop_codon:yes gene_type:complete